MGSGYRIPRVPGMSGKRAEQIAATVLREYAPNLLNEPAAFPVGHFFEFYMPERYKVTTGVADLPLGIEGITTSNRHVVLAADVYEQMLENDGRSRFTALHECVHGIVHVPILEELRCSQGASPEGILYCSNQIPAYANPEWQAHRVAGSLLMPPLAVREVMSRLGPTPSHLASVFCVSPSAAAVRLSQLGQLGWLP